MSVVVVFLRFGVVASCSISCRSRLSFVIEFGRCGVVRRSSMRFGVVGRSGESYGVMFGSIGFV